MLLQPKNAQNAMLSNFHGLPDVPGSVRTRYDLLDTEVRGRPQYAY